MELDPACAATVDWRVALREALDGKRVPAKWMRSEEEVEAHAQQLQQQQDMAKTIQAVQAGGDAAQSAALAEQELNAAAA
jgi:hypothetical protein